MRGLLAISARMAASCNNAGGTARSGGRSPLASVSIVRLRYRTARSTGAHRTYLQDIINPAPRNTPLPEKGCRTLKTADPEKRWERTAARFRERAIRDRRGVRRDRSKGDEAEAILRARLELKWPPSELARLFERDERTITRAMNAAEVAQQARSEREKLSVITLPARQAQMLRHHRDLKRVCHALSSEASEAGAAILRRPKDVEPEVQIQNDGLFHCLREHKPASSAWYELAAWQRQARRLGRTCSKLWLAVQETALVRSGLGISTDLQSPGVHPTFWGSIFASGLSEVGGQPPLDYDQRDGPSKGVKILLYGAYPIAAAQAGEIQRLEMLHRDLRAEFASSAEGNKLRRQEQQLEDARARLSAAMDEMVLAGFSDGTCHVCRQWLI